MANKKTSKGADHTGKSADAMPKGATLQDHPNVTVVESREEFEREAQRLRDSGYTEVPGFLGGGHGGSLGIDYADYVSAKLDCEASAGSAGKGQLPLLHVSSGVAQPVTAENGHKGAYITWGTGNKVPNVISLLCSLLPYTAAALKWNIDLCCGMGPRPMYAYTQYVGGNITEKLIKYEDAGTLLRGMIRDLQLQLVKLEREHPELNDNEPQVVVPGVATAPDGSPSGTTPKKTAAEQMRDDINEQIEQLRRDLAIWEQTNAEVKAFLQNNNLLQTFQQLYSDMLQYNICFPEFELQQTYLVPTGREKDGKPEMKQVPASRWSPKVTGLKWRNAKTMRLEQLTKENKIEYVYISNQWLSSPDTTLFTKDSDTKIDALPALTYQSPAADMERLARKARKAYAAPNARPTRMIMPVAYNEYGHPYYPVPAWYSCFSGDVYTYASLLISDRKKRRDNANVIGRILYVSDEYIQRMYIQRHLDTPEQRREFFNKEIVEPINNFLKNRDNMGEPMLAYTFKDADGKVYKSWEIVEVQENNASQAEANKEELAEISSIILFTWGVDSTLIGNTPGTTVRSGGTDLRERYLLKQINMSTMQSLVMNTLNVVNIRNQWDPHLQWQIKKEVLTTLDNSKTGITTAETN